MANRRARGQRRPLHHDYCRTTRKGRFGLGRKPQARRVRRTLKRIGLVLRRRRHDPPEEVAVWLRSVLGGWLRYFAVPTSHPYLSAFIASVKWLWFRQLRQRSQKRSILDLWKLARNWRAAIFLHFASCTHGQTNGFRPSTPEVGAQCVNAHAGIRAGGHGATRAPTATSRCWKTPEFAALSSPWTRCTQPATPRMRSCARMAPTTCSP